MKFKESVLYELLKKCKEINGHQKNPYAHPLTCGNNSQDHALLVPMLNTQNFEIVLICPDCDYKQTNVPRHLMPDREECRKGFEKLGIPIKV